MQGPYPYGACVGRALSVERGLSVGRGLQAHNMFTPPRDESYSAYASVSECGAGGVGAQYLFGARTHNLFGGGCRRRSSGSQAAKTPASSPSRSRYLL